MSSFLSAKHAFLRLAGMVPLLLSVFLISLVIPAITPPTYAAALVPHLPHSGGSCPQYSYGVSADADTIIGGTQFGNMYSFSQQWAPAIAAAPCMGGPGVWVESTIVGASSYDLSYTVNNLTTVVTLDNTQIATDSSAGIMSFGVLLGSDQLYTLRLRACYVNFGCSSWSPHVSVNTYANIYCQNGYVFREAYAYDQVCVTPDQRTQVAIDTSLASSRVNPNGASGPKSCISGYVWRDAIGADYVCVTPGERAQVASDNSQSSAHILQI